jgi:cytochrome c oxidase subunit III
MSLATTVHPAHGASAHGHVHDPNVAHHFYDMEQQHESAKLGVWLFLLTEILLFGGLFCFYAIYRAWHPELFHEMHKYLDWKMGALNTVVLITSSLTAALAIRAIQQDKRKQCVALLIATVIFAGVFMVVKYFEYSHKIHLGILPGKYFADTAVQGANPHVFFSIYFAMTGLHGFHVLGGMVFLSWVAYKVAKGKYSSQHYTSIEMGGLYWHLVDLIWIYLFPLLYLIG